MVVVKAARAKGTRRATPSAGARDDVIALSREDVVALLEKDAQTSLGCSGEEALRRLDCGELDGTAAAGHFRMLRALLRAA